MTLDEFLNALLEIEASLDRALGPELTVFSFGGDDGKTGGNSD